MQFRLWLTQVLERLCHVIAATFLLVALIGTVLDVCLRKTIDFPIHGIIDIVGFCIVISTMLGIALAWSARAHIVVDLIDMTGSPRLLAFLDVLTRVAGIITMPLLMWLGYREFSDVYDFGDRTSDLGIPLAWFWLAILVGYGLSAVLLLIAPPARAVPHA